MITIRLSTHIAAPPERVFDLTRSIDLHTHSLDWTREEPVAGRMSGLIGLDETVTWCARHLGVRQRLTSRISAYDRPVYFQDVMVRGAFAWMEHDHWFDATPDGGTVLRDDFRFAAPLESATFRWFVWRDDAFVPFVPPPVGATIRLASALP